MSRLSKGMGESELLYEALQQKHIAATFWDVKNAQHAGVVWQQDPIVKIMIEFFGRYLG